MSTRTVAGVLLAAGALLAALFAGIAFFWTPSPDSVPTAAADAPAGAATGSAAPAPAEPAELERPAERPAEPVPLTERRALAPAPADGVEAAGADSAPALTGRVVDRLGNGLPGARVTFWSHAGGVRALRSDAHSAERTGVETDAEGRFSVESPGSESLVFSVRARGFAPFERTGIVPREGADTELEDFVLTRGALLGGVVVDAGGRAVAGAQLWGEDPHDAPRLFLGGELEPLAETNADGVFEVEHLACGPWRVRVTHDEHPDGVFEGLADRPGEVVGGLEFRLPRAGWIDGRVTGVPSDEDPTRLVVRAYPVGEEGFWSTFGPGVRETEVDGRGEFRLQGLREGETYRLQARRERPGGAFFQRSTSLSEAVEAVAGARGVVLTYQPESVVRFQVVDAANGEPIERMTVMGGFPWPHALRDGEGVIQRHFEEGRVRFDDLRPRPATAFALEVRAVGYEEYRRDDVQVPAGGEVDLGVLRLQPVPLVRVTVLDDETGRPIEGAQATLTVRREDGGPSFDGERRMRFDVRIEEDDGDGPTIVSGPDDVRTARTDEGGLAALTSFEGETCSLRVTADDYAPHATVDLHLPRGELVDRVVRLSRGSSVRVTVLSPAGEPVSGIEVAHRPPRAAGGAPSLSGLLGHERPRTDADGHVRFDHLEPGVHAFRIREGGGGLWMGGGRERMVFHASEELDDGEDWTEIELDGRGERELVLTMPERGAVRGRVTEAGRPLAGASISLREVTDESTEALAMRMAGLGGGGGPQTRTDGDGLYELEGVELGEYTLTVEHPTRRMPSEFSAVLRGGTERMDLDLSLSIIEGRVTDLAGEPVQGAKVTPERARPEGEPRARAMFVMMTSDGSDEEVSFSDGGTGDHAITDGDGRYVLRGVTPDQDLVLRAEHPDAQPAQSEPVRVAPDQTRTGVDLELEPGGALRVAALQADGNPARFVIVTARYRDDDSVEPKTSFIGPTGSTTLDGLRPGPWTVSVRAAGPGGDSAEPPPEEVYDVTAGKTTEASFTLP